MRQLLAILILLGVTLSMVQSAAASRVVDLTTVCLLDGGQYRDRDYVVRMAAEACERGASDLVVLPYTPFVTFREAQAESDLADFAALARAHGTYLCLALTEQAGERVHATSVLLDRAGKVAFKWRKTHALPDDDVSLGDTLEVYKADFGAIGATVGTDFYFPEVYEVLRMKGAEVLIWQDYPERFRDHSGWEALLQARAFDSHCHMLTATYADPRAYLANRYEMGMQGTAWGRSQVLNRVGVPVADTGYEDGAATARVDLDKRKISNMDPWVQSENLFFVNCVADRKALEPVCWPVTGRGSRALDDVHTRDSEDGGAQVPALQPLPHFAKRTARIAVVALSEYWGAGGLPTKILAMLDEVAKLKPDLVLFSENSANDQDETVRKGMEMVAAKAKEMRCYVCIGGVGSAEQSSIARIWDREGKEVYGQPLYWVKGFPEIKVLHTDFARIGCHSCGDLYTPMFDRVLALKGAELILDPSQMWGPNGRVNEALLRARAMDNGVWMACAHWNSSDPGLRSTIVDPYGQVMASSRFQRDDVIVQDIDFGDKRVYYEGLKTPQPQRAETGIEAYFSEDCPEQKAGWQEMIFARRRPELYGVIPTVNDVILKYRPATYP